MQRTQAFPHVPVWNTTHFDTKTPAAKFERSRAKTSEFFRLVTLSVNTNPKL